MRFRITPLNIVAGLALAFFLASFFQANSNTGKFDFSTLYKGVLGATVIVAFITDMIFRVIFKDLKRIWFVELVFISLTIIIFLLLQK